MSEPSRVARHRVALSADQGRALSFGQTFASHNPSATATVSGKIGKKQITGALAMKRFIAKEHHFCRGSATFTASN